MLNNNNNDISRYTIYGFVLPLFVAVVYQVWDVAAAVLLCLITGILNHTPRFRSPVFRALDLVVVWIVGAYFTTLSVIQYTREQNGYYIVTWIFAAVSTVCFLVFLKMRRPDLHYIVHVTAIIGILAYILAE